MRPPLLFPEEKPPRFLALPRGGHSRLGDRVEGEFAADREVACRRRPCRDERPFVAQTLDATDSSQPPTDPDHFRDERARARRRRRRKDAQGRQIPEKLPLFASRAASAS